jgi:hypothetical protein
MSAIVTTHNLFTRDTGEHRLACNPGCERDFGKMAPAPHPSIRKLDCCTQLSQHGQELGVDVGNAACAHAFPVCRCHILIMRGTSTQTMP